MIVDGPTFHWTDEQISALARLLLDAEARRRRDGLDVPPAARGPFDEVVRVAAARAEMTRTGQKVARPAVGAAPSEVRAVADRFVLPSQAVARRLGVSPRTVRRRAAKAKVGLLVAGRLVLSERDVEVLRSDRGREVSAPVAVGRSGLPEVVPP